jgi:hypothetical protein
MGTNTRFLISLLVVVLLFSSAGSLILCEGCSGKAMDCCKGSPTAAESIGKASCCQFRMNPAVERHPGRVVPAAYRVPQDGSGIAEAREVSNQDVSGVIALHRWPPSLGPPYSSIPLFILNTSLLC